MRNPQNPVARKEGLVIQEMPQEVLVYDLNTNKAHCLNQTAAFVWQSCDGQNTVADIKTLAEKEFGKGVNEDFIWLAIDQLSNDNLLTEKINADFKGVSRREVIKKIGLASMMALPIVASLSAPNAALASGTCAATSCASPTQCSAPCNFCRGTCSVGGTPCAVGGGPCGGTGTCNAAGAICSANL